MVKKRKVEEKTKNRIRVLKTIKRIGGETGKERNNEISSLKKLSDCMFKNDNIQPFTAPRGKIWVMFKNMGDTQS